MSNFEVVEGAEAVELERSIFDPNRTIDLNSLYQRGREEDVRGAAYKTVATFAGLAQRKLWLKEGNFPSTDGHEILAPFKNPFFYRIVEHELAHILFQSSIEGKVAFIRLYVEQVKKSFALQGQALEDHHADHLKELLSVIIGILEDARVESLWALLYPGSFIEMQAMHKHMVLKFIGRAHLCPSTYLCVVSAKVEPPTGPYDYLRPAMEEALLKVERRGFAATLAVSKWLMQQFVSEIAQPRRAPQNPQTQSLAAQALQRLKNRTSTTPEEAPPPEDRAVLKDAGARSRAFEKLLEVMGCPSALYSWRDDVKPTKYPTKEEREKGQKVADFVSTLDTKDAGKLEEFLASSGTKMAEVVERAMKTLGQQMEHDGWISKNAYGKVNLKDVGVRKSEMPALEDRGSVQRLRSVFYRVLGRRRYTLHDSGSEIDVSAYIEGLVSRQSVPCFRTEQSGRGFKALVLLDRSGSMGGAKSEQAERACRTLEASLLFPFVDFHVWGFQSLKMGEIDISRFRPGRLNFSSDEAKVAGATPLHLALRVAVRFMEQGNEAKHLILITDGAPTHATRTINRFSTQSLLTHARSEIRHARRSGMSVTGIIIGDEMKDSQLSFMLGAPANWRRMKTERLGEGLVQIVASSFTKYLRNN